MSSSAITSKSRKLKAPFPYFGGKSRIALAVWGRFGDVHNYVEPFFGSGAVLLARPTPFSGAETVNDLDGLLTNFWRAVQQAPQEVAAWADWPVNELDLYARHKRLIEWTLPLTERLRADETYFDARAAGWWVWGLSQWIGGRWCAGSARAQRVPPHMGPAMGVHRISLRRPYLSVGGTGVHRCSLQRRDRTHAKPPLIEYLERLAERLRYVRVCCGDWSRVCGRTPTYSHGPNRCISRSALRGRGGPRASYIRPRPGRTQRRRARVGH